MNPRRRLRRIRGKFHSSTRRVLYSIRQLAPLQSKFSYSFAFPSLLFLPFPMYLPSPSLFVFAFAYTHVYPCLSHSSTPLSPILFASTRLASTRLDSPLDASCYINNRKLCTPRIRTLNPFPSSLSTLYLRLSILVPIHRYIVVCTWLLHGSVATGTPVHPDNEYPTCARQKTVGACERHWFSAFNEVRGSQGIEEVAFHWLFHLAKR